MLRRVSAERRGRLQVSVTTMPAPHQGGKPLRSESLPLVEDNGSLVRRWPVPVAWRGCRAAADEAVLPKATRAGREGPLEMVCRFERPGPGYPVWELDAEVTACGASSAEGLSPTVATDDLRAEGEIRCESPDAS